MIRQYVLYADLDHVGRRDVGEMWDTWPGWMKELHLKRKRRCEMWREIMNWIPIVLLGVAILILLFVLWKCI